MVPTRWWAIVALLVVPGLTSLSWTDAFFNVNAQRGTSPYRRKESASSVISPPSATSLPSPGLRPMAQQLDSGTMDKVLFIQCGWGNDQHGQNPTKACVRACRNAIEFNSLPAIRDIVPGGYDQMKLKVQLAVPTEKDELDLNEIRKVFPYGNLLPIEVQQGGMRASSGIAIKELGDKNDDMIIAIACVSVGY